jgi:hypothetical protein
MHYNMIHWDPVNLWMSRCKSLSGDFFIFYFFFWGGGVQIEKTTKTKKEDNQSQQKKRWGEGQKGINDLGLTMFCMI